MYLSRLEVRNLKLIRHLTLDLLQQGRPRMWTVLIGENGTCKTTLLQAVAMAASGPTRANQLADAASFHDRRPAASADGGAVFAEFERPSASSGGSSLTSQIFLNPGEAVFRGRSSWIRGGLDGPERDPIETVRSRNEPGWFVAGYGIERRLPRPLGTDKFEDPAFGRLQSLFDKGGIIGTGFADLVSDSQGFATILREVLVRSGLLPLASALELRGRGGVNGATQLVERHRFTFGAGSAAVKLPALWLSQGYQAVIAWVADIVGQVFWERGVSTPAAEMQGLVLVDEIDLHLHPQWQRDLVRVLKEVFPRLQFIATTHSPLVLTGLDAEEIVRLRLDPGSLDVVVEQPTDQEPALMTGSGLYQVYFGVDPLYPNRVGEELRRYGLLAGNAARTTEEEAEMEGLRERLAGEGVEPGWEPVTSSVDLGE